MHLGSSQLGPRKIGSSKQLIGKEKSNIYLYLWSRFNRLALVSLWQQCEQPKPSTSARWRRREGHTAPDSLTQLAVNLLRRNLHHMFYTSTSLFIASFSALGGIIDLRARWLDAAINDLRWKRVFLCGPFPGTALDYLPPSARASSSGWVMPSQEWRTNDGPSVTRRPRKCRGKVIFVKTRTFVSYRLSVIHPLILLLPSFPLPRPAS